MKAFVVISSLITLAASSAFAVVRPEGGFIPSACGRQVAVRNANLDAHVLQICVGQVVGVQQKSQLPAVSFRLSNGSELLYRVVKRANPFVALMSGDTQAVFYLQSLDGVDQRVMKVLIAPTGAVKMAQGTLGEMNYLVKEFMPVFVTQSEAFSANEEAIRSWY